MADNLIEQFFIDIELNAKGVGKQAKEIDKILDGMGQRASKREARNYKKQGDAHKTFLDKKLKAEAAYGRDSKIQAAKAEKEWRRREKISSLMPNNPLANKSATSSASIFEKQFDKEDALKVKANRKELDRLKEIENARLKQHVAGMTRKNAELNNMKDFYKQQEKAAGRAAKRASQVDKQMARIQGTAWYGKFKAGGGDTFDFEKKLRSAIDDGDAVKVTNLTNKMKRLTAEQERYNRSLKKTNIVQKGVEDSTRNMIRSYASMFALFEGTVAIKRIGTEYEGMNAAMLAASGSTEAAANDMIFLNGMVDQMGLNLKNTTDAWVKFKFAAKGKISQEQQEDIFTGLSMFGTSLKVGDEDMKRSQRAIIQIDDYCLAA